MQRGKGMAAVLPASFLMMRSSTYMRRMLQKCSGGMACAECYSNGVGEGRDVLLWGPAYEVAHLGQRQLPQRAAVHVRHNVPNSNLQERHASHVRCLMLHVTRHTSHVTRHTCPLRAAAPSAASDFTK